ncbi:PREDICTED: unconventional myosin-XVB-like [Tinamus guttatus]|uniref:unconventional myosin-XVB-like n=1 Tax=Tinamus guttatus TaxID=94827 RepID=UPI00052EF30B|nr:PREDICTED: unconventional myosin-XVB-like [Tinamus guttatus]
MASCVSWMTRLHCLRPLTTLSCRSVITITGTALGTPNPSYLCQSSLSNTMGALSPIRSTSFLLKTVTSCVLRCWISSLRAASSWCLTFSRRLRLPTISKGSWGAEGKGSSLRSHAFFIRCITPNPRKVFLREKARQLLERRRSQRQTWAIVTLQRNFHRLLHRRRLCVLQEKVTIIQAYFRGYQASPRNIPSSCALLQHRQAGGREGQPPFLPGSRQQQEFEEGNQRRKSLASGDTENGPSPGMDVGLLEIPAELAALLHLAEDQYQAQAKQITETLPPEVKVKDDLSLPPAINSYPFSTFIKSHFQNTDFPAPGQPLHHPLTHLEVEHRESALEINKLILRFIGDKNLPGWQEVLLGNYIVGRGLKNLSLRDEILSQVVSQAWKNPDMEQGRRAWVLMTTLLSSFAPSPALEKPLLKFVSDHGMEGYNAVCQRKILTTKPHTEIDPAASRAYPPTQLEWTANQRKGKMVLDVHTFNEEKFSAEVESWMTGEQYAAWLLNARGCDKNTRGWSVSMFTGDTCQNLLGCDFVLDLIGEMEEARSPSNSSRSSVTYPLAPEQDFQNSNLDL